MDADAHLLTMTNLHWNVNSPTFVIAAKPQYDFYSPWDEVVLIVVIALKSRIAYSWICAMTGRDSNYELK